MKIQTSRFGELEVDERRLIRFEKGILGFPDQQRYALIQTGQDSGFYWLQAVDRADLAFVVCDPRRNRLIVEGDKDDAVDPGKLCELYRLGALRSVHHPRTRHAVDLRRWVWLYVPVR